MLELFWNLMCFFLGITVGKTRAVNSDITERTAYMQNLIDIAYAERDESKRLLELEKLRVDMWQQRYDNLLEEFDKVLEDQE